MIIDPNIAVEKGWIKLSKYAKVQQSGIDVSLKTIKGLSWLDGEGNAQYYDIGVMDDKYWLAGQGAYDFICNETVEVPQDVCAMLFVRSSYNRRGMFVTTGLYDNGYKGVIQGMVRTAIPITVPKNERIAQIVFMKCDHTAQYNGQYQDQKEK